MICVAGSWGGWFNYFCAVYRTSHQRRKANRQEAADPEESKMCPLAHAFDLQIHDAIANLRRLDGSIQPHKDHGRSVDFFTEKGKRKFWLKSRTPVFDTCSSTLWTRWCVLSFQMLLAGYLASPKCGRAGQAHITRCHCSCLDVGSIWDFYPLNMAKYHKYLG